MKIDFEISDEMCEAIIQRMNYVKEKVVLYYNEYEDYGNGMVKLNGIEHWVLYNKDHKPKELQEEKPLLEKCKQYLRDTVLKKLINQWLMNVLLQHHPYTQSHVASSEI